MRRSRSSGGVCMSLIQQALEKTSRASLSLRNFLVETLGLVPLYPCPHSNACPMSAASSKDWCYSEWQVPLPRLQQAIDEATGVTRDRIAASAFLFASKDVALALGWKPNLSQAPVVVGRPLLRTAPLTRPTPKGFQYLLCNDQGTLHHAPQSGNKTLLRGEVTRSSRPGRKT